MKKLLITIIILLWASGAFGATYYIDTTCSDGTAYDPVTPACTGGSDIVKNSISDINGIDFSSGDTISFRKGQTFSDTDLTLNGITSPSGKSVTITSHGSGDLPKIGGTSSIIEIDNVGLSIIIENINIDGQKYLTSIKLYLNHLNNITLDNIEADGSVGYDTECTPDLNCAEVTAILIDNPTGTVEIKNCTIENWGGDEDIWGTPAVPAKIGIDRQGIAVSNQSSGTISIHDNTISNIEADCISLQNDQGTSISVYDNTSKNCGENSIDFKGSKNITMYDNHMYRDATWVGVGGSSSILTDTAIVSIFGCDYEGCGKTYGVENVEIYSNKIGPSDLSNISIVDADTTQNETQNINVYRNWFYDAKRHFIIKNRINNLQIYNNIVSTVKSNGLFAFLYFNASSMPATAPKFYNNTFYSGSDTGTPSAYLGVNPYALFLILDDNEYGSCINPVLENNIFYINDDNAPAGTGNWIISWESACNPTLDHNLFYNAYAGNDEIICADSVTQACGGTAYGEDDQTSWISAGHTGAVFDNPDMTNPSSDDFTLTSVSPAIDAGSGLGDTYDDGWDPATSMPPNTVSTLDQDNYGDDWEIGAYVFGFTISYPIPTSSQECTSDPRLVTFGVTSSENATCRYSTKGTDTCATAYASLDTEFENTGATTTHTDTDDNFNCDSTTTLVVKCLDDATSSIESNCLEIVVGVAPAGGEPPQPNIGGINIDTGGTVSISTGGTVNIE